mgnify:CR=1 FL=1
MATTLNDLKPLCKAILDDHIAKGGAGDACDLLITAGTALNNQPATLRFTIRQGGSSIKVLDSSTEDFDAYVEGITETL